MLNPLLRHTLAYTLGIFIVYALPELPNFGLLLVLLCLVPFFTSAKRRLLLCTLFGLFYTTFVAQHRLQEALPESWIKQTVQVAGHIAGRTLSEGGGGWSVLCEVQRVCTQQTCQTVSFSARAQGQGAPPEVGDDVVFEGIFKHLARYKNPGGRDIARQAFLYHQPYRLAWRNTLDVQHHPYSFAAFRARWMEVLFARTKDLPYGYVIPSIVFGVKANWDDDLMAVLRHTGTGHLFAISGMHIALAFRAASALSVYLTRHLWLRACFGLLVALFYAALAGFAWPTVRAFIMLTFLCVSTTCAAYLSLFDALVFSWLVILLFDPFAAMEVSFWLSFCAVAFIGTWPGVDRLSGFWRTLHTQYRLSLGMAPLVVGFFGQYSWISPITNLFAVPWFAATTIPLSLLGALLFPIWPVLSSLLFEAASVTLQILFTVLGCFARLPFASSLVMLPLWSLVLLTLGGFLILWPHSNNRKVLGLCCLLLACLGWNAQRGPEGYARVTVLDIGQGLGMVIETRHHALVYDTGPRFLQHAAAQNTLVPFIRHQGIAQIDALIVSHEDNDHRGGLETVQAAFPVHRLYTSFEYPKAEPCHWAPPWTWDGVDFAFISLKDLPAPANKKKNNRSCILQVTVGTQKILLPGDIEAPSEAYLVDKYGAQLRSTILISPHHGSKSSSTDRFLNAVSPDIILIALGVDNAFGHPHQNVVARYVARGIPMHRTDTEGAIQVLVSPTDFTCTTQANLSPHWWDAYGRH